MAKLAVLLLLIALVAACGGGGGTATIVTQTTPQPPPAPGPLTKKLKVLFAAGGRYAEDSMYACLADALAQGIPYQQALELCETKLLETALEEFGEAPFDPIGSQPGMRTRRPFDPAKVTAACSSGDPGIAADGGSRVYEDPQGRQWGSYSWGSGEGKKGLSEADSRAAKEAAVAEALAADAVLDAVETARRAVFEKIATEKVKNAQALTNAVYHLTSAALAAAAAAAVKATKDPNATPPPPQPPPTPTTTPTPTTEPAPTSPAPTSPQPTGPAPEPTAPTPTSPQSRSDSSECDEALQGAREYLYECNRNGWSTYGCKQLEAKAHRCPDPALILVDPEQGYTCGDTPDPLALVSAWKARCQQLKRGVDGEDPCSLPRLDESFRKVSGTGGFDPCTDPAARVDPESGACAGTLVLPDLGTVDIHEIYVFALNLFGGPIFVLPKDPRPPGGWSPGPEPRPPPPTATVPEP